MLLLFTKGQRLRRKRGVGEEVEGKGENKAERNYEWGRAYQGSGRDNSVTMLS